MSFKKHSVFLIALLSSQINATTLTTECENYITTICKNIVGVQNPYNLNIDVSPTRERSFYSDYYNNIILSVVVSFEDWALFTFKVHPGLDVKECLATDMHLELR